MELLHESRLDIKKIEGKAYFFQVRPEISEEPVIRPDTLADGGGTSIYGSVLHDSGRYRMWYQAWPKDWDGGDVSLVAYAESDDGIEWKKPDLGLVDYGGKGSNLCDLGFHCPAVFVDPQSNPSHRYRATGFSRPNRVGSAMVSRAGYFAAHSADGLHWVLDGTEPIWEGGDVITSVYHPEQNRAVAAIKRSYRVSGVPRRSILNAEFVDGRWSQMRSALLPDEFDDVCALSRGFASGDYYGMGMMPAGSGIVGFLWQFRHSLPRTQGSNAGVFGVTDVTLAFQERRGDRWVHCAGRQDFICHRDVTWGQGGVYTAASSVEIGDTQRLYFSGSLHTHAWYLDSEWNLQADRRDQLIEAGMARIGYATWAKDRLFGFRSDPKGVVELQIEGVTEPVELHLNYRCEPGGSIRVETELESDRLGGDQIDARVTWSGRPVISPPNRQPLVIRIHLDSSEIYAYELRQA